MGNILLYRDYSMKGATCAPIFVGSRILWVQDQRNADLILHTNCPCLPCKVNCSSLLIFGGNVAELLKTRVNTGNVAGWHAPGQQPLTGLLATIASAMHETPSVCLLIAAVCSAQASTVCHNGQWVEGSVCTICSNGQYVGGLVCVLLSNGSFKGGQTGSTPPPSRMQNSQPWVEPTRVDSTPFNNQLQSPLDLVPSAPDARRDNAPRNRNDNSFTQCPDGTYVKGGCCVMTSSGRYVGRW